MSGNADDPDGLVFRRPDGTIIEAGARPVRPDGPPPMPARPYEHPLGERLDTASLFFKDPPSPARPPEPGDDDVERHQRARTSAGVDPPGEPGDPAAPRAPAA